MLWRVTIFVPIGNLEQANLRASMAVSSGTPAISNITLPGLITATQWSTAPLPLPIRVSAARAVTVVHELLDDGQLALDRFVVEGHGEAHPLLPNDSAENRATNRRVELTVIQGDGMTGSSASSQIKENLGGFNNPPTPGEPAVVIDAG